MTPEQIDAIVLKEIHTEKSLSTETNSNTSKKPPLPTRKKDMDKEKTADEYLERAEEEMNALLRRSGMHLNEIERKRLGRIIYNPKGREIQEALLSPRQEILTGKMKALIGSVRNALGLKPEDIIPQKYADKIDNLRKKMMAEIDRRISNAKERYDWMAKSVIKEMILDMIPLVYTENKRALEELKSQFFDEIILPNNMSPYMVSSKIHTDVLKIACKNVLMKKLTDDKRHQHLDLKKCTKENIKKCASLLNSEIIPRQLEIFKYTDQLIEEVMVGLGEKNPPFGSKKEIIQTLRDELVFFYIENFTEKFALLKDFLISKLQGKLSLFKKYIEPQDVKDVINNYLAKVEEEKKIAEENKKVESPIKSILPIQTEDKFIEELKTAVHKKKQETNLSTSSSSSENSKQPSKRESQDDTFFTPLRTKTLLKSSLNNSSDKTGSFIKNRSDSNTSNNNLPRKLSAVEEPKNKQENKNILVSPRSNNQLKK